MSCLILTYHSHVVNGDRYQSNDHIALECDLRRLQQRKIRILPLSWVVDWLRGERADAEVRGAVAISFDDGCVLDVTDVDYPGHGRQRGFLSILRDFAASTPENHPPLQATTFVIASEAARKVMDTDAFSARGWMGHEWWMQLLAEPLMEVQNHSWDHGQKAPDGAGGFAAVADRPACEQQVAAAGRMIARLAGLDAVPDLFAYPYGESSIYLREQYLPQHGPRIGLRAAFTTQPCQVTRDTSIWSIPRYVRGCDWTSPDDFDRLLDTLPENTGRLAL